MNPTDDAALSIVPEVPEDVELVSDDVTEPLDSDRLESIAQRLRIHRESFERTASAAFVTLVYSAGPLLDEVAKAMPKSDFWLWAEHAVGYKRGMTRTIIALYREFPEAEYGERLRKISSAEKLHQLVTTDNPRQFLDEVHYVPRTGKRTKVEDMETTRDVRQAKAHKKASAKAQEVVTIPRKRVKGPLTAAELIVVLRAGDTMVLLWRKIADRLAEIEKVTAPQLKMLHKIRGGLSAVVEALDDFLARE